MTVLLEYLNIYHSEQNIPMLKFNTHFIKLLILCAGYFHHLMVLLTCVCMDKHRYKHVYTVGQETRRMPTEAHACFNKSNADKVQEFFSNSLPFSNFFNTD